LTITKDGLQYLMSLKELETVEIDGLEYQTKTLYRVPEVSPEPFTTKSLLSIVELINKEHEHNRLNDLIIHVVGPELVEVHSCLRDDLGRFLLYVAKAEIPAQKLGMYTDLEDMIIRLKSTFVESEARDALVKLLGGVVEEAVKTSTDDGITQTVTAKTGIATVSKVTINPIVELAPYRTFIEVDQPEGEFLLRLQNGPKAALFEADGGAWRMQARKNIKSYFEDKLADLILLDKLIVTE